MVRRVSAMWRGGLLNPRQGAVAAPAAYAAEALERRVMLAADVLNYHNDLAATGQNLAETVLTRANVNATTFGKRFTYLVDGQVYAQPLVERNVTMTGGPNAGVHDVVFVATEHDSVYAIDAGTLDGADAPAGAGRLLWQRSFLDLADPNDHLPNATALTTVPVGDVNTSDITPEIGITGTPVIDAAGGTLYVVVKTKETVAGVGHYVQRLHAVRVGDGADRVAPVLIGNTVVNGTTYTNNTPVYAYGNGDGHTTDPYNGTGRQVVQFNALRALQQGALTLVNGVVYVTWTSHANNGPTHGWVIGFDQTTLALKGVLNTTPNGGQGGIGLGGGGPTTDGTYLYVETGRGTFDGNNGSATAANPGAPAPGPITGLNAQGFPVVGDYANSILKVALDPATTPQSQNINGWGLKVVDYFTPFNEPYLNNFGISLGSSACVVVPDSYGSAAHPHLLIGSGEEGVIYLMDRDNLGKFGLQNNVVQSVAGQLTGTYGAPAMYNGRVYYVNGFVGVAKAFTLGGAQLRTAADSQSADSFGALDSTPSVTANGTANGIVWVVDRGANQLRAYSSDSYATELYTSDQAPGGRDALGRAVKFQGITAVNGHVYVGSGTGAPNNMLVVYGLFPAPDPPGRPDLADASDSGASSADDLTDDNTPTFTGPAAPNSVVTVLIDGQPAGSGAASAGGAYSVTTGPLPDGTHTVSAVATASTGSVPSAPSPGLTVTIDTQAPQVAAVRVAGSAWSPGFLDWLASHGLGAAGPGGGFGLDTASNAAVALLPWLNLDQVCLDFSEVPAAPASGALAVMGSGAADYADPTAAPARSGDGRTVAWALRTPLKLDRVRLALTGVTDLAGNPLADFLLPVNVVPGDADRNGRVDAFDTLGARARQRSNATTNTANYAPLYDVDGNGRIDAFDTLGIRAKQGTNINQVPLPTAGPLFGARAIEAPSDGGLAGQLEREQLLA